MRRLLPLVLLLCLASTAAAATIHGTARGELIVGTAQPDSIRAGGGADRIQVAWGAVDRVDCGAAGDVVSADLSDRVAASCEIVARRLSVDPFTNSDSQHETAVEPDSAAFGSTVVAAFQVGRRENGGASNIGTAVSTDAGRTWRRSFLPGVTIYSSPRGTEVAASDPSVAYDAVHRTWLVSSLTLEQNATHVYVSRSSDGRSWSAPVVAAGGPQLDKEWIACDNGAASPFRGRCYLEYTDDQQSITVSQFTTDGGQTWSAPVRADAFLVGTQPGVQPNGTLVVVAGDFRGESALTGAIVALRSTDGGATFSRTVISDLQSASNSPMRGIALPSAGVDSKGTIYAAWNDCRFRTACAHNDLVLSTSADGITWSQPVRIPLAPATSDSNFFVPGLSADPAHPGHLAVDYATFSAGACRAGACTLDVGVVQSRDGGATWSPPQRLDAQPFSTSWVPKAEGQMIGDYLSTSFAHNRLVAVFPLATSPLGAKLRQGIFAASLRPLR